MRAHINKEAFNNRSGVILYAFYTTGVPTTICKFINSSAAAADRKRFDALSHMCTLHYTRRRVLHCYTRVRPWYIRRRCIENIILL